MRRWRLRAVKSTALRRPALRCSPCILPRPPRLYSSSAAAGHSKQRNQHHRPPRKYAVFRNICKPDGDIDAWIALLDGALPPHLRDRSKSTEPRVLSAVDVAEILLAAQYPQDGSKAYDLLYHLAFDHGRWNAVVWLIKDLVQRFPALHTRKRRLSQVNSIWDKVPSLKGFTETPINAGLDEVLPHAAEIGERRTLDQLTGRRPHGERSLLALGHDALGQVWRTLGEMAKTCAGGDIRPEVLEIVAYLHHKEVMPMSIYQSEPHPDGSAIQQPPLLSILSSRILTSLSDAAWRAHEKLVVEEAKAKGAEYAALRPEVPGSVYRVNVTGLRPELWMELILWSCIQGGWTLPGTEILRSISRDEHWKPLSWRQYEKTIPSTSHTNALQWLRWELAYKTRDASRMDAPRGPKIDVQRTVSAEVVNAYIDALSNHVDLGVGRRGARFEDVVRILHELKSFLHSSRLDLSFGSWDALITRLVESQTIVPEWDAGKTQQLHTLSVGFRSGIVAVNVQDQPAYVRDGNLAMQGLLHRALYGQIATGNLEGALKVFKQIQTRADFDKQKSLQTFIERRVIEKLIQDDMFTSNYSGIDYPAFKIELPTTILGSLLDLVTDAKEYDFGRWLLHSDEVDGPVIGEALYEDPFVQPAIVRFAAASNDRSLLAKLPRLGLLKDSFRAVFDTQVDTLRWDVALSILEHLADNPGRKWGIRNLANLARVMLSELRHALAGDPGSIENLDKARTIFRDMVSGRYNGNRVATPPKEFHIQNVLSVLSAIDGSWARFCFGLRVTVSRHPFLLKAHNFNLILEGVVGTYGSAAGRRLLGIFWPRSARTAHGAALILGGDWSTRTRTSRTCPSVLQSLFRQRISVKVPGDHGDKHSELLMYGALTPNVNTILIILRKALQELNEGSGLVRTADTNGNTADADIHGNDDSEGLHDNSTRGMVRWAVRHLAELPYADKSVIERLDKTLLESGMDKLRGELPAMLHVVESEPFADAEEHSAKSNADKQEQDFPAW